jgi:hypothetical protein
MLPGAVESANITATEESGPDFQPWGDTLIKISGKPHTKVMHKEHPGEAPDHEVFVEERPFTPEASTTSISEKNLRLISALIFVSDS